MTRGTINLSGPPCVIPPAEPFTCPPQPINLVDTTPLNRMRTLLMTLALAIGLGTMAQSGDADKKSVAERAADKTAEMTKQLGLTTEQSAKVGEINKRHFQGMADIRKLTDERARNNRERILKENRDKSLQTVLTPEQYEKLMKIRAEKKEEKKEKDTKKPHNE